MVTIFEREVRLERGANRAITKAQQANIDTTYMGCPPPNVNHSFCSAPTTACSICQLITNGLTQHQDEQPQQQQFAETQRGNRLRRLGLHLLRLNYPKHCKKWLLLEMQTTILETMQSALC